MAKSPEEMEASMIQNLKDKSGKSLEEWIGIVSSSKLAKHGEIVKYLKGEHGLGHGYANLVTHHALRAAEPGQAGELGLLEAQYTGPKAALRPIYEALVGLAQKFGKDVEISPKKTYVSLRRNKQFALIQATTATRIDLGINLKGTPPSSRLEASGSFNSMVSHRVRLAKLDEVDSQVEGWLRAAYDAA